MYSFPPSIKPYPILSATQTAFINAAAKAPNHPLATQIVDKLSRQFTPK